MSERIDKTMSMVAANVWANVLAIPLFAVFLGGFVLVWGLPTELSWTAGQWLAAVGIFIISIVIHELLHGIGYRMGGAAWSQIKFGVKHFTPYAHCEIPLKVGAYRWAVVLPGVVLGLMPALVSLLIGSWPLVLYGSLMSAAALGDVLILWLLRDVPAAAQVQDHPSKVGCEILI